MIRQQKVNSIFSGRKTFSLLRIWKRQTEQKMKKSLSGNLNLGQKVRRSVIGGLASQKKIQIWPWQPSPQLNTFKEKSFALHCSSCAPNSCRRVPNSTESIGFGWKFFGQCFHLSRRVHYWVQFNAEHSPLAQKPRNVREILSGTRRMDHLPSFNRDCRPKLKRSAL